MHGGLGGTRVRKSAQRAAQRAAPKARARGWVRQPLREHVPGPRSHPLTPPQNTNDDCRPGACPADNTLALAGVDLGGAWLQGSDRAHEGPRARMCRRPARGPARQPPAGMPGIPLEAIDHHIARLDQVIDER